MVIDPIRNIIHKKSPPDLRLFSPWTKPRMCTFKICSRPFTSGRPTATRRSKRPRDTVKHRQGRGRVLCNGWNMLKYMGKIWLDIIGFHIWVYLNSKILNISNYILNLSKILQMHTGLIVRYRCRWNIRPQDSLSFTHVDRTAWGLFELRGNSNRLSVVTSTSETDDSTSNFISKLI